MTSEDLIRSAVRAALIVEPRLDTVPEGYLTADQVGHYLNRSRPTVQRLIAKAKREGRLESQKFVIKRSNNGSYPTVHYKFF